MLFMRPAFNHLRMASRAWRQSAEFSGMFLRRALLPLGCERLRFKCPPRLAPARALCLLRPSGLSLRLWLSFRPIFPTMSNQRNEKLNSEKHTSYLHICQVKFNHRLLEILLVNLFMIFGKRTFLKRTQRALKS